MGVPVEGGEWAIVGGTGRFAMATGVIKKRVHESTTEENIIELTIEGFCSLLKGSTVRHSINRHIYLNLSFAYSID